MFMHIISIKYGPAAAGIIGALYTEGVQTDGSFEVPVLLKWQGTTEEEKGCSALQAKTETPSQVPETSWHQELR